MFDSQNLEKTIDTDYLESIGVVAIFEGVATKLKTEYDYGRAEVEQDHPDRPGQVALKYSERPSGTYTNSAQSTKTHTYILDRITGQVVRVEGYISGVRIKGIMGRRVFSEPDDLAELGAYLLALATTPVVFHTTAPIKRHSADPREKSPSMMIERTPRKR